MLQCFSGFYALGTECGLIHRSTRCSQIVLYRMIRRAGKREHVCSHCTVRSNPMSYWRKGNHRPLPFAEQKRVQLRSESFALYRNSNWLFLTRNPISEPLHALISELCSVEPRGSVLTVAFTSLNAVLFRITNPKTVPNFKLPFIAYCERFLARCPFLHGDTSRSWVRKSGPYGRIISYLAIMHLFHIITLKITTMCPLNYN
jgi:hypothetical protein